MTIHQIIQTFQQTANYIHDINSFEFGDKFNQNQSNTKMYPQLFLETPFLYSRNGGAYTYDVNIQILDRAVEDNNNVDRYSETLSKCQQIGDQIVELLRLNLSQFNTSIRFNSGITIISEFADNLTGVRLDLNIITPLQVNQCEIVKDPNYTTDLVDYLNYNKICP